MIKLIVSDLYGTLLNDKNELSSNFDGIIKELQEHNIKFVAVSGEPIDKLKHHFKKHGKDILFIADNGAVIDLHTNKNLIFPMSKDLISSIIQKFKSINNSNLHLVLCSTDSAYLETTDNDITKEIKNFYSTITQVEKLEEVTDNIVKIILFSNENIEHILKEFTTFELSYCQPMNKLGSHCIEFMSKDASKGSALKLIQSKLCVIPQETMVFGRYDDNIEMFKRAFFAYAMDGSSDEILKLSTETLGTNNENSVCKKIESYISKFIYGRL